MKNPKYWQTLLAPAPYSRVAPWFLWSVYAVYFLAFTSLAVQIVPLVGEEGLLPIAEFNRAVAGRLGWWERALYFPGLTWLSPSDTMLLFLCWGGAAAALVAFRYPVPGLVICWVFYLSLCTAGSRFLGFQWDGLLQEAGFLGLLLVLSGSKTPARWLVLLFQILLFKLMFSSGMVKLLSGDPVWRNLTALIYHYETQPIPNRLAWLVHQLPGFFHVASALVMFLIELLVPFLIFFRRTRLIAFTSFASLQLLILLTGNYAFFNILSLSLCLWLISDDRFRETRATSPSTRHHPAWIFAYFLLLLFQSARFTETLGGFNWLPYPLSSISDTARYWRVSNNYGLFAVMTTERKEIVIEGSNDREEWLPYEFRWKAGDTGAAPPWVAPHQPRLDWQMWFAALGPYQKTRWLPVLMVKLLKGSEPVLGLLAHNPFPARPPLYIRARLFRYRFTSFGENGWWKREFIGNYSPVLEIK